MSPRGSTKKKNESVSNGLVNGVVKDSDILLSAIDESMTTSLTKRNQDREVTFLVPLWNHQKNALRISRIRTSLGLRFDTGTGKTATAVNILRQLFLDHGAFLSTFILVPTSVGENWNREFRRHSHKKFYDKVCVACGGSTKKKLSQLQKGVNRGACIFIMNHETFGATDYKQRVMDIVGITGWPSVLVIDESHRFKGRGSNRVKGVQYIAEAASKFRLLLTGTPVLNSAEDLWSQCRILSPEIFPGNFFTFRAKYFYDANASWAGSHNYFPKWKLKPDAEKEISQIMGRYWLEARKEDCLDLPPLVRQTVYVGMTREQQRIYQDLERDFFAWVDEEEKTLESAVSTPLALTRSLRLQQICSGVIKTADYKTKSIPTKKPEMLKELVKEITDSGKKVIVWTCWRDTYQPIAEAIDSLGVGFVSITGDTKDKQESIDQFQNNPGVQVVIANQGAGGTGINLQEASYMIYYSKNYNLEHDLQSEARNFRAGSEIHDKITRIDLVTEGTIEEQITEALREKKSFAEMLMQVRKER